MNRSSYTHLEDQILLEHWWDRKQRGEIHAALGRTLNALGLRYYKLMKNLNVSIEIYRRDMERKTRSGEIQPLESKLTLGLQCEEQTTREVKSHEPPLGYEVVYNQDVDEKLESLENKVTQLGDTIENGNRTFVSWLENILYMYKSGGSFADVALLTRENSDLRQQVKEYQQKLELIEDKFRREKEQHEKLYNELEFWLGQFFKMSSIEKITTLQDFVPRIKAVVDSYGTVLGISTEKKMLELPTTYQKIS